MALLALPELLSDGAPRWLHWSPLLVPLGLACLTPPVLTWICNLVFRVLRRPPLDVTFSWTGVGIAVLSLLGTWLAYGLQITLLGWSLGADPGDLLLPATGAFAAAWCAGFLVVVVPTGAGTREAVLTLALAALLPGGTAAALTIAVLSRLLLTLADVAAALIGVVLGRGARLAPEPPPPTSPVSPPAAGSQTGRVATATRPVPRSGASRCRYRNGSVASSIPRPTGPPAGCWCRPLAAVRSSGVAAGVGIAGVARRPPRRGAGRPAGCGPPPARSPAASRRPAPAAPPAPPRPAARPAGPGRTGGSGRP